MGGAEKILDTNEKDGWAGCADELRFVDDGVMIPVLFRVARVCK